MYQIEYEEEHVNHANLHMVLRCYMCEIDLINNKRTPSKTSEELRNSHPLKIYVARVNDFYNNNLYRESNKKINNESQLYSRNSKLLSIDSKVSFINSIGNLSQISENDSTYITNNTISNRSKALVLLRWSQTCNL